MNQPPTPLIPRPAIVVVTVVILGAICYATYVGDYRIMMILSAVLLFILGADVGAMLRTWRGQPDTPPPPSLEKDER